MLRRVGALAAASALAAVLTACGGSEDPGRPPAPESTDMGAWCYAETWLHQATSTYYYLYGLTRPSTAEITKSAAYGGHLMNSYQANVEQGRLPEGIQDDLRAWALHLQVMQGSGWKIGAYTDRVLRLCQG